MFLRKGGEERAADERNHRSDSNRLQRGNGERLDKRKQNLHYQDFMCRLPPAGKVSHPFENPREKPNVIQQRGEKLRHAGNYNTRGGRWGIGGIKNHGKQYL